MKRLFIFLIMIIGLMYTFNLHSETLFIDCRNGLDTNSGTKNQPLHSFERAVELVNSSKESGSTTLIISPGVYRLTKTILIKNDRPYTASERFTVTAEILPDDPLWKPELMPVLISTAVPDGWLQPNTIVEYTGIKPEINHVTIQGLKFLGSPVPEIWYYPIFREGKSLDDLLVTQCVFAMEDYAVTCNVGVLANGHGLVVDHCIFVNCRNPVVFWDAEGDISYRNAMRYCIIQNAYTSACWVCDTNSDFEFHHNIIDGAEYVWMRNTSNTYTYSLSDCIITDYHHYSGRVIGPDFELGTTEREIVYGETRVEHDEKVLLEAGDGLDHRIPIDLFHPIPGSPGSKLDAGLFKSSIKHQKYGKIQVMERTVAYKTIDNHQILADVFSPEPDDPVPAVIYIHGGGMMFASRKHLWSPLKESLLRNGIGVVSIDFRLAPEAKIESILEDTQDALNWVRTEADDLFGIDPKRVALIGGSSGAYQALIAACRAEDKPDAVVAVSGLGDLDLLMQGMNNTDRSEMDRNDEVFSILSKTPITESEDMKRLELAGYLAEKGWMLLELLGFNPTVESERWESLQFSKVIPENFPPTLVIHSENDRNVPIAEAYKIMDALKTKKIPSDFLIVPEGHSSFLIEQNPEAVKRMIGFLKEHLLEE